MSEPVNVRILDREYLVACEPYERDGLLRAAAVLDGQMRDIRRGNKMAGIDRIAVLAALTLAHELTQLRGQKDERQQDMAKDIAELNRKLDQLL